MIKLTVIYGHPTNEVAFEDYYHNTHLPLAAKMSGFDKVEFTKFLNPKKNHSDNEKTNQVF